MSVGSMPAGSIALWLCGEPSRVCSIGWIGVASGQTATSMFAGHYTELVDRFGEPDTDESRGALDCIDAARRHGHWAGVSAAECDVVLRWDVGERCAVLHVSATTERDGVVALTMYYPERRALDAGALRDPLPLDPS